MTKVRTMAAAIAHHGRAKRSMRCPASDCSVGHEREPGGQSDGRADDRGGGSDRGAVGQHDQADVAVGGAEGAEHAQGPQSSLGHDGESGHGHQADEEQPERAEHQHDGLGRDLVGGAAGLDADTGTARQAERLQALLAGVEEDGDVGRRGDLAGGDQGELVQQVQRVLDHPDDLPGPAVLRSRRFRRGGRRSWRRLLVTATSPGPVG